jgi:putative redox protein
MAIIKSKAKLIDNVCSIVDNTKQHCFVLDLPESKGGDNKGPTALELAIMSLADCAVTIFADVAKKNNVDLEVLQVNAEAEKADDSPVLSKVKLQVNVASNARDQKIQALWRRTEANCPVIKIFTDKIPVEAKLIIS